MFRVITAINMCQKLTCFNNITHASRTLFTSRSSCNMAAQIAKSHIAPHISLCAVSIVCHFSHWQGEMFTFLWNAAALVVTLWTCYGAL